MRVSDFDMVAIAQPRQFNICKKLVIAVVAGHAGALPDDVDRQK